MHTDFKKQEGKGTVGLNSGEKRLMDALEEAFEPLLTAEEAAAHLRIHPKTLMKMARNFQVPCLRIGKYWRFRLSALDEWLRGTENQSSQPFRVK